MFSGKEYVYAVYKEKSFSAAAKKLYITQPALSNNIKRIENKLGTPLFDRSTSPVQLTEVGIRYIKACEQIFAIEEEFNNYMDDNKELRTGHIHVGGSDMIISYILPQYLSAFHNTYPLVDVHISELDLVNGLTRVANGSLDLFFASEEIVDARFEKSYVTSEHLFLAVPRSFPVTGRLRAYQQSRSNILNGQVFEKMYPIVPLDEFNDIPFILLNENESAYQSMLNALSTAGLTPKAAFYMNQELTAYNMTISGMGASFVSDTLIRNTNENPDVVYYKLDPDICKRSIWLYKKMNRYLTKSIKTFLNYIK